MKELFIKPIDIARTNDVEMLIESFYLKQKFVVCSGKEGVGKTALCYKLLNGLLINEKKDWKPLFICMDNLMKNKYWQEKFYEKIDDELLLEKFENIPFLFPFRNDDSFDFIIAKINEYKTSFIILDGYDNLVKHENSKIDFRMGVKLFIIYNLLKELYNEHKTTVFITWQKKYDIINNTYTRIPFEFWELERPKYIREDMLEYGETRLRIFE